MDVIFSLENIEEAVIQFLQISKGQKLFAFHGQMGAGKTTFIQAVCHAKGVTGTMGSPTFSIINEYKTHWGEIIFHIDLYRLQNEQEAINLCFVEWPQRATGILPENTVHCYLETLENNQRKLKIKL